MDSAQTNLENILSQIKSLKAQEQIQIKQLENQLANLNSSLKNIQDSLVVQKIYAQVEGKVKHKNVSKWNKVWANTLLCQIVPLKSSLKMQVFGNNLKKWMK